MARKNPGFHRYMMRMLRFASKAEALAGDQITNGTQPYQQTLRQQAKGQKQRENNVYPWANWKIDSVKNVPLLHNAFIISSLEQNHSC
jgi:hypothetical protein